jgi:uncharacterized protein (DUF1800 family)
MSAAFRISRRQAIGLAAGGAVGAAGLRLVTLHLGGAQPAVSAAGAWNSPLTSARGAAAHLLRRAGFAYSAADLDGAASMKYADLVDSIVNQQPDPMAAPTQQTNYAAVVQTWYAHMATTKAQFPERMTLFWHGHFTSDYRKSNRFPYVSLQNATYRKNALGDLRTLATAVTFDPLMIRYLDLDQSSGKSPNENYARELMELFTLGVGNYTETDVREAARALSGIRIQFLDPQGHPAKSPTIDRKSPTGQQDFYARLEQMAQQGYMSKGYLVGTAHDQTSKTFLGRMGNLGPTEVIDTILSQDACATFIASKALLYFASPQPSPGYVQRVATAFRSSKYDIRTMMRAIFNDAEFLVPDNYRSLMRSPADYMVATMRAVGQPDISKAAVTAGQGMDQVLYDPPTVGGWPVNAGWISSSAMLARLNFAQAVVNRGGSLPDPAQAVQTHLDGVVGADTARVYDASTTISDRWYALLGSPEFQLK